MNLWRELKYYAGDVWHRWVHGAWVRWRCPFCLRRHVWRWEQKPIPDMVLKVWCRRCGRESFLKEGEVV